MNDIATHLRITGLQYENNDVDARRAAILGLKTAWFKVNGPNAIILKAQDVAIALIEAHPTDALGAEVQTAVQKKASAFLYENRPLEVGIIAGLAAQNLIESTQPQASGWMIADIWSMALWSALSFHQPLLDPKREALRGQIFAVAKERTVEGAEKARERIIVADIDDPSSGELPPVKIQSAIRVAVDGLRRNSALDREELDFLWWTLADRSRILGMRLSKLNESTRLVAAAIDASSLLRRLPCEVHRELILRNVEADPEFDLAGLIAELGSACSELAAPFQDLASIAPMVFPVLSAMAVGAAPDSNSARIKRKSSEWALRVLLEGAMLQVKETGPKRK